MKVEMLQGDCSRWDRFVMAAEDSTLYHLSGWREVIERSFGHRTYYLFAREGSGIKGILPLVHIRSRLFGSYMLSLPYFNYGGICAMGNEAEEALLENAVELARRLGVSHIEMRERARRQGLMVKTSKVSMLLGLPESAEALWKRLPSKLRSQIKRPGKEGMRSVVGDIEMLNDFYAVFTENMRDLGTPVYSRNFFRNILETFPDKTRLCTVYHGSKPVASGFLAGFRDTLEIPWASSIRRYNRFGTNMLLYWNCLKWAVENGYARFDFGRSSPGSGTYRFKKQWGAAPVQLYWHYWLKEGGPLPEINPSNPRYRVFINIWKNLPLWLTRLIGPGIVKNLP